jgi:phosphoribosyl-AMP cyclohydrolase / phosphoribosyl-ATP pyrophosphohydrolase
MNLKFEKYADGLIPSIVQDAATGRVLMLGFMDDEAIETTRSTGRVTFYSRSKDRLWTKGETSGNYLEFVSATPDCDVDTLLIKARPLGPACHTGAGTCFGETNESIGFLHELESIIAARRTASATGSYVAKLFGKGLNKIAQKVGEEAVETVIAAKDDDTDPFINEAADLLFHLLILLNAKDVALGDVVEILQDRHQSKNLRSRNIE